MTQAIRQQPSGARNRRASKARARALAAAGQLELKLVVAAATLDPLVQCNDISDDDVASPTRLAAALAELLPDMISHYAKRLEEHEPRALPLDRLTLPGARTPIGEATPADLELALHEIGRQTFELAWWDGWLRMIQPKLPAGKTVREVLSLEQLRAMRSLSRPR